MIDRARRNRSIVIVLLGLVAAVWLARFIGHEMTVDSCFDAGGVYLEEIQKCSYSQDEVDSYRPKQD